MQSTVSPSLTLAKSSLTRVTGLARIGSYSHQLVKLQCPTQFGWPSSTCYVSQGKCIQVCQTNNTRCFGTFHYGRQQYQKDLTLNKRSIQKVVMRNAATKRKEVAQQDTGTETSLTMGEKVKQAGKDAGYTSVFIVGFGITGLMFFAIGRELLSGNSPSGVYSRAFKKCKKCEELSDVIGTPMKGYGEMSRRGRRRHTNHTEFEVDGVQVMRMKFYVEGPLGKGTAQLEVRKNDGKNYDFRYLFVTLDQFPHSTIIVEDSR